MEFIEAANIWALLHPGGGAPQRLALILLPFICPLHRQTHHMVVPLNGAECVAVVRAEIHKIFYGGGTEDSWLCDR